MNAKEFIEFIKQGTFLSIEEIAEYATREKMLDVFIFFCEKHSINIPKKYQLLQIIKKNISKKRFEYIIKYMDELNKSGLHCFLIKGPVVSMYLYGDYYSRLYDDIDLVVPPNEYLLMNNILLKNNFANAFVNKNEMKKYGSDFFYNIKGEDNVYCKNENEVEIGFEVRDCIRFLNDSQMKIIYKNLLCNNYNEYSFYCTNLDYTIIVHIIYTYIAYFTEYGIINKHKMKYIIELHMLISVNQYDVNVIYKMCKKLNIEYMFEKVIDYYNMVFINNALNANGDLLNYILNSFDNNDLVLKDYYISLFNKDDFESVISGFDLNRFNNKGRYRINIYRDFTNKKNIRCKYLEYEIFSSKDNIVFFVSFPRYLDDTTFQITLVNNLNYQYELEFTFYKKSINEYRSSIPFEYAFNYFDHQRKCIIFKIGKETFKHYVSDRVFLFKIVLRKIWKNKYPTITNEHIDYKRFILQR